MLSSLGRTLAGTLGFQLAQQQPRGALVAVAHARTAAQRAFSSSGGAGISAADVQSEVQAINDSFSQAREDIEDAREDAETTYFNESAAIARESVESVLKRWDTLIARLPDKERGELTRSMGLKMEQLKAELKELDELHA